MGSGEVVFRARRVVTPDGERAASVRARDGRIVEVTEIDAAAGGAKLIDVGDAMLLPGLVDTHVHLNEPGREEWEGFESGTLAAAAGGVTTVVDMPLNSIPATTTVAALEAKRAAARGRCRMDVAFWGGVVPGNADRLEPLWNAGVLGFKCFLVPSGVPEFEHVTEDDLRIALPILARLGAPLLVHAELPGSIVEATTGDPRAYATYLSTRPDAAEVEAVELLVRLCRETRARVHIVHVSSAEVLAILREARAGGLPITAETCPHYLHFAAEQVPAGGTEWKCAPPIRSGSNRERLWHALAEGDLDLIASDHSPAPAERKLRAEGDCLRAWGGIASLQLGLSVIWSDASRRGHAMRDVVRWMADAPAHMAGLTDKGRIAPGCDADLIVFDPDAEWTVDATALHHRHKLTPYDGEHLRGRVVATYLRGDLIYRDAAVIGPPRGHLLGRNTGSASS